METTEVKNEALAEKERIEKEKAALLVEKKRDSFVEWISQQANRL